MKNRSYRKDGNWESMGGMNFSKEWEKYDGTKYEALVYENGEYVINRLEYDPIYGGPMRVCEAEGFKTSAKAATYYIDMVRDRL